LQHQSPLLKNNVKRVFGLILLVFFGRSILSHRLLADDHNRAIYQKTGWHVKQIQVNRIQRFFNYYIPKSKLKTRPTLVLLLHGGTRNPKKLFSKHAGSNKKWLELAEQEGFILITPSGGNPKTKNAKGKKLNWNDCRVDSKNSRYSTGLDDVAFVK